MAGKPPEVALVGFRSLRKDLARMVEDRGPLDDALKAAGKKAVEPIYTTVKAVLPHDSGDLAGDVRSSGTRTGAVVRMGRVKIPYAGWIEFGGVRPDGSERDFVSTGRYLYPTARGRLATTVADLYSREIQSLINRFGWTNTGTTGGSVHD
jgi:hypothetical protein